MATTLVLIAVAFFVAAIIVGSVTNNSWKSVGFTYGLLSVGAALFGIALTL